MSEFLAYVAGFAIGFFIYEWGWRCGFNEALRREKLYGTHHVE